MPQYKDPAEQRAAVYRALLEDAHREGLVGDAAIKQAKFETDVMLAPQVSQRAQQDAFEETIMENFLVYCVCATRGPILMWSHYADGHKGVALHFAPSAMPFDRMYRVHYAERYPEYPFPAFNEIADSDAAHAMLYTKSRHWYYEEEHRAIRVVAEGNEQQRLHRDMGLAWDGQIATLHDNALIGITLGAAMPKELVEALMAEIAARRPSLAIWQAFTGTNTYSLDFERVR